jgi:hypothetical protein
MKKRLLFAFMAMCVAVSGFALSNGEFVYTPQGRFQISGDNLNANNAFQDMSGWTVISTSKTLADKFNIVANGLSAGFNSVACVDVPTEEANKGEGMYFKFEPTDASGTYIVSFKLKGAPLDVIQTFIPGDGYSTPTNLVKVAGNTAGSYTYPETTDEVVVNTAEELGEEWQTFYYAIQGDGTARTWFISFTTMATTIEIADLQIAPAYQYADLRQRDALLTKLKAYKEVYNWPAETWTKFDGYPEVIANLEAIGDESSQAELDELATIAKEVLDEFLYESMDDYLSNDQQNYLGIKETEGNTQKVSNYGEWTCLPTGRAFWNSGAYPDLGHFGGNNAWCYSAPNDPMGVYMSKTFDPGSYVFSIESLAALRADPTSTSWTLNEAWNPAYGVASIVKVVDGTPTDTLVSVVQGLDSRVYTPFVVPFQITEGGTYEIAFKAWCKDAYKDLKNGSVVYVKDASLYGKNDNKYNQKQLAYEADVREQITTGRDNLTKATGYIANAEYLWGKGVLQACVDTVETKIAKYEAMNQDDIIATYDREAYVRADRTKTAEAGLLVFEVYNEAVRDILAANKLFEAVNDTLNSMQAVIVNAEKTLSMRLYDAATGKAALQAAIDKAKGIQAQMKAAEYSEENAATIVAANKELEEAVALFTTTIPADCIATLVDIDFEKNAELDFDTFFYTIPGEKGSMVFPSFSEQAATNQEYEKGFWSNGEQLWKGYLRVGNGEGTVNFDPTENGSMGTNILKVACDFYVQGLSGKSLGFYLKYVNEEQQDVDVFGIFHNFYNGTNTTNTCDADLSYIWAKSGGSYANASPADATDSITANPLEKTHFEVIMDYGKKTQYCTISSVNGSTTSQEVALDAIPTKFILKCDYNNNDRRAWFDNLLIQRVKAGAYDPSGIETVKATAKAGNNAIYNLAGQKVGKDYKGLVIMNGKKTIQK